MSLGAAVAERVELALTVAVSREAGSSAKVRFWVVELGADATARRKRRGGSR
jgi:Trypsin-co-occurring domain 2